MPRLNELAEHTIEVGAFSVTPAGGLLRHNPHRPVEFTFDYDGVSYIARAMQRDGVGILEIVGHLGIVPYSAESQAQRQKILGGVSAQEDTGGGRIGLTPHQELVVTGPVPIALPMTAVNIVTAIAEFLLHVAPLAREFGPLAARRPPPAAAACRQFAGRLKTWPG